MFLVQMTAQVTRHSLGDCKLSKVTAFGDLRLRGS